MFFIVRTDVDAKSGQQRSFGAFDLEEQARDYIRDFLQPHMRGVFEVFEGTLKPAS
jgi:hypothetical protein